MANSFFTIHLVALVTMVLLSSDLAADEAGKRRAKPPEWPRDVVEVFFDDARDALVGARPDYEEQARPIQLSGRGPKNTPTTSGSGYAWSDLVEADTIEAEIKRLVAPLGPLVATPSAFKGGGYRDCRDHFSWLAVLFAVASDYDEEVRWQDTAEGLSQLYARAGFNCKVGTDQSFRESQLRVEDLGELVRGGRPDVPPVKPDIGWDQIADRTPLMRRMEVALAERISPNASDGRALTGNADDLRHEAQLVAILAHVITQEGFADADDQSYTAHADSLRDAAVRFSQATDREDFQSARAALGDMSKACSNCHDEWR
ncbi:MAG: hypothetical protein ACR2NU_13905 [Aeoliella sp.]